MLSLIVDFHFGDMLSAGRTVEPIGVVDACGGLHVPLLPAGVSLSGPINFIENNTHL